MLHFFEMWRTILKISKEAKPLKIEIHFLQCTSKVVLNLQQKSLLKKKTF